jgi:uncharacterized membrane protein
MSYVLLSLAALAAFVLFVVAVYRAGRRGAHRYHAPVGGPPDHDVERQLEELRAMGGSGDLARYLH